jgi:hypothetical protein
MENRHVFRAVLLAVAIVGALTAAGFYGYNLGVARGLAESPAAFAAPAAAGGAPIFVYPRPWGYGFGFFPFFPLLFIFFWIFVARALFWRGGRWRRGYGYYGSGVPPMFDEWHRRAHAQERPDAPPPAPRTV